jgi:alpha-ketoglutarate-dependent taurine dioxygenase
MTSSLKENNVDFSFKIVQKHWLTNEPVLRMRFPIVKEIDMSPDLDDLNKFSMLYSVDERIPTLEEKIQYNTICQKIVRLLHSEEDYVKIQKWQQGDLLIVDIHSLIHAVTGGFTSDKRKFLGMWSYQKDLLTEPEIDVEKRLQNKSV